MALTSVINEVYFYVVTHVMIFEGETWSHRVLHQENLTEREGSVQLTSLYQLIPISCFSHCNYIFLFHKTTYLGEEVKMRFPFSNSSLPAMQWSPHGCVQALLPKIRRDCIFFCEIHFHTYLIQSSWGLHYYKTKRASNSRLG